MAEAVLLLFRSVIRLALLITSLFLISSCSINRGESDVCFVGDSIFDIWDVEASFPNFIVHKHAVIGAKIQDLDDWDLSDCKDIPTVFLMGTNNIGKSYLDTANTQKNQQKHTDEVLKRLEKIDAKPLLYVSILPRSTNNKEGLSINYYIESLNSLVEQSLDSAEVDYRYINAFDYFIDRDYLIKKNLFKDGLHPNAEGYEVLTARILKVL
ncbi:MAG: GDSL-type esterase/lipase family protein [Candidatus Saccharibacteria bacterium]|nr:GDSL-type esterase/lipase family protein [Candidatus Saccharibacteria bacterium]